MTRTIWLASYPKSGNTWLRILIANLATTGKPVDINDIPEPRSIATGRQTFDDIMLIDSDLLSHDEIDRLRPRLYEELAQQRLPVTLPVRREDVHFVKVHDAYTLNPDGEPLLAGRRGAAGAVVIVRDPRDVVCSLANHNRITLDKAIRQINNGKAEYSGRTERCERQLRHKLLNWRGHVASWLDQSDIPVHLVRYEDMLLDTATELKRCLAFADKDVTEDALAHAVRCSQFSAVQEQERLHGFRERPASNREGMFFRQGKAGAWLEELNPEQIDSIESANADMMVRLGYTLSGGVSVSADIRRT